MKPDSARVLFLMDNIGVGGGTETMAVTLIPKLRALGVDVSVAVLYRPTFPTFTEHVRELGVRLIEFDVTRMWDLHKTTSLLVRLQRNHKFDLIHARLYFPSVTLALARPALGKVATVVSFHATDYDVYASDTLKRIARKKTWAWLMRVPDGLVGNSRAVARHYAEHLRLPRVDAIPNALDLDVIDRMGAHAERLHARYSIPEGVRIGILPSRFIERKGHSHLLQALERTPALPVHILFAGDGPLEQSIREESERRGVASRVTFCGLLPHEDLVAHVAASDFVLLPSKGEGFPMAVLEAMALRRPVIAAPSGSIPELITDGESGLLFEYGDALGLARAIERLASDADLRERLGKAARRRVEEEYTLDRVGPRWRDYYTRLIANSRGQPSEGTPGR